MIRGFLVLLFGLVYLLPASAEERVARVLIVHSYDKAHICGGPQAEGVIEALAQHGWREGQNLRVESFYMDTKKSFTTPEAIRERGRLALALAESFRPDVVVVLDDNAIREVMLPLVNRLDVAIVFSGMNGQPEGYNQKRRFIESLRRPGGNVTGVYEKLYVLKSLIVMNAALSHLREGDKVVGITDFSPTGNAITRQFELELAGQELPLGWELRRVRDFEEYKGLIRELNEDPSVKAIYPAALSLRTADGETFTAGKIFDWTTSHSTKPEMALNYYFSKIGLFGGAAVDFTSMGRMAGEKVAKILAGHPAGELPIEDARDYAIVFNLKRANALGISIPEPLLTAADHVYHEGQDPAQAMR
jgi:hypothetical protein